MTDHYDVARELVSLGIGEALVTALSPRGVPLPTVHCVMRPPRSLMAPVDAAAFAGIVARSEIAAEYAADVDPEFGKGDAGRAPEGRFGAGLDAAAARGSGAVADAAGRDADLGRGDPRGSGRSARGDGRACPRAVGSCRLSRRRRDSRGRSQPSRRNDGVLDMEEAAKMGTDILTSSTQQHAAPRGLRCAGDRPDPVAGPRRRAGDDARLAPQGRIRPSSPSPRARSPARPPREDVRRTAPPGSRPPPGGPW